MARTAREIKALIVLTLMIAFGLASCQSESVTPQKINSSKAQDKEHFFLLEDDSTSLKPPREPSPGGGGGGTGGGGG